MSRSRRLAAALILLLAVPVQAAEVRDVLGSAHVAGRYSFSDQDFLNEGADRLLELGTRVIKVWFQLDASQAYPFNSDWGPPAADLAELARKPYYRQLFDKPFSTYILVISSFSPAGSSQWLDGMTPDEADGEREHVYKLARHLLTAYAGSGKTFVLQNWEGDHLLRQGLAGADPDPVRLQGMIDWWNARQDGVEQARREVGLHGVMVAHAAEVNLLAQAMEGKVTATNDVVPYTRADLYSYSSWDLGFDRRRLTRALDYLEAQAPDSELFGRRNIYLGELGAVKDHLNGAPLRSGDRVTLQAHDGLYLSAENGGGGAVHARSTEVREDEVFHLWKIGGGALLDGDEVAFQARSGRYLVAEPGTLKVTATRWAIGVAETFRLVLAD